MHAKLRSRLENWKFAQAVPYLSGEPPEVREVVVALAALLGDCGWGIGGALGCIVEAVVGMLLDHEPLVAEGEEEA